MFMLMLVMNLYTSKDDLLTITDFHFDTPMSVQASSAVRDGNIPPALKEYMTRLMNGEFSVENAQYAKNTGEILHATPAEYFGEASFGKSFFPGLEDRMSPRRLCKLVEMYNKLLKKGTDEVLIDVESNWNELTGRTMYTLALSNVLVKPTLARICKYIESKGFVIERCHLDRMKQDIVFENSVSHPYATVFGSFLVFC